MALVLASFFILLVRSIVARVGGPKNLPRESSSKVAWMVARAAVYVSIAPAILDAPLIMGAGAKLSGDSGSHLAIAQEIVRGHLVHGWIPTYNGGFPFSLHYPAVGWLLTAGLLKVGIPPITAMKGLGFLATLAVPLLGFETLRRRGVRATSAATATIAIMWMAPYIQFTGGWEPFLVVGLISQALVMPFVVLWAFALTRKENAVSTSRWDVAPLFAALCAATHPQVFSAAAIAISVGSIGFMNRIIFRRVARSLLAGGAVAIALYLPGMIALRVPFGWPTNLSWRVIGFGPDRMLPWLRDGEFLDYRHNPVVTYLWIAALLVHVVSIVRHPMSRALLLATITTLGICLAGPSMPSILLSVAQPMRALAIVPILVAITIATAIDLFATWLYALRIRLRRQPSVIAFRLTAILPIGAILLGISEIPTRAAALHKILESEHRYPTTDACLPFLPGVDMNTVSRWLASSSNAGRAAYDSIGMGGCAMTEGGELARNAPLGATFAAGAHVGVHVVAFSKLIREDTDTVSEARAEALGVRTLIHRKNKHPTPSSAWRELESHGNITLVRRIGGHDYVGAGCIVERLAGNEAVLAKEVYRRLEKRPPDNDVPLLDHPTDLVALDHTSNPTLTTEKIPLGDCDPTNTSITETPREPGAFEADIQTPKPVDIVFRATAYEGWGVRDGPTSLPVTRVAPGFFAVRVGEGHHHLTAVVSLPTYYGWSVLFGVVFAILLCVRRFRLRRRHNRT